MKKNVNFFGTIFKKPPEKSSYLLQNTVIYAFIRKNDNFIIRKVKKKRYVTQETFPKLS